MRVTGDFKCALAQVEAHVLCCDIKFNVCEDTTIPLDVCEGRAKANDPDCAVCATGHN